MPFMKTTTRRPDSPTRVTHARTTRHPGTKWGSMWRGGGGFRSTDSLADRCNLGCPTVRADVSAATRCRRVSSRGYGIGSVRLRLDSKKITTLPPLSLRLLKLTTWSKQRARRFEQRRGEHGVVLPAHYFCHMIGLSRCRSSLMRWLNLVIQHTRRQQQRRQLSSSSSYFYLRRACRNSSSQG